MYYNEKDPDKVHNLADDARFQSKKSELKAALFKWLEEVGDMGEIEEKVLVNDTWWEGKGMPKKTEDPKIQREGNGVSLTSDTPGVSIGYRIFDGAIQDTTIVRAIKTWDFKFYLPKDGGETVQVPKPWKVYLGGTIPLEKGQRILVNAQRIGYLPTEKSYKLK